MTNILTIFGALILMGIALAVFFQLYRFLFSYKVDNAGVTIRLFHYIVIHKIPFTNIEKIYIVPIHKAVAIGLHFFSRPFNRRVLIEKKEGWFKFVFITPENPDIFIAEVKKRISASE